VGYAGLEASTVVLAESFVSNEGPVDLWLAQIAHEIRPTGPQTSVYCNHWMFEPATVTIKRLDGEVVLTEPGFTSVSEIGRGAAICARFDEREVVTLPPVPPPTVATPVESFPPENEATLFGWTVVLFGGEDFICRRVDPFSGEFDCYRYYGGPPPVTAFETVQGTGTCRPGWPTTATAT